MKTSKISIALSLGFTLILSSCSSGDDADVSANLSGIQEIESTVQSGNWRITNMNDSGEDETSDFAGYRFTFSDDGSVTATNGAITQNGSWSVIDDRDDDDAEDDIDFNLFFPVPDTSDFEDLNDDWDIVSISDSKIELIDDGDLDELPDLLTFERD
jgi:hypothetical protein